MERYDLQTLPALLGHPGPWDYFWQRLPYALPGFLTFLIGGCLAVFALSALRGRTRPVGLLVSAAVLFFTVCTLGLALALRSVVLDAGFLLMLHYCLYAVIPALLPASFALIYFTTDKAYPVAKYAAWALLPTWFFVLWELANGTAFSGRWMFYAFGNYPQGGLSLTVWGVAGAASYLFIGLPIWINVIRKIQSGTFKNSGRLNIPFVVGLNLLWILIVGNLPALLGIGVYPPAFFLFIPLLLLSYGIFRSDFLDLNDFLFQRHGVFYLMSGALALVFVGIGAAVAWGLSAGDFVGKPWHGAMVPLVSVVTTFSLGIFIGGVNPGHRTNQLGSASLFIAGFISLFVMIEFLGLDLVVSYRLRQLSWIVIAFVLSVHFRFAFAAMGKSPPSIRWFFDGASVVISLLATTPLLLAGSYAFPFAMVAAAGPLMSIQAALQAVMIGIALYYYWQVRGSLNNPLGGRVALATLLFGVLGLLSVPAALGFPVYSLGSLQFIPGLIIAHAVLRHGVIPVHRQALAITQRLSASLLVVVPVSIMFFSAWLPAGAPVAERLFYLVLVALPLFLAGYIVVFILAKPVAERLDASYLAVARERHTAEEARRELEQLNLFTRQLSASTDLDVIVDQVTRYVEDHYGFQYTVIYLMDAARHELYSYRASRENPGWTSDHKRYLSRIRYALDGEDLAAKVHWKRRPIYIPNVTASTKLTPHEKEITDTIGLRSVFMVPLMVNDEPVGQVHFVNNEP
ncbi:MAG: GAF domain-containing protein, partial [Spirochaetia bacterium]|nr:GAF domain-containing protein [Spirochaetia bacterium]